MKCTYEDISVWITALYSVDENGGALDALGDDDLAAGYPYSCQVHNEEFATWDDVQEHLTEHENDKPEGN